MGYDIILLKNAVKVIQTQIRNTKMDYLEAQLTKLRYDLMAQKQRIDWIMDHQKIFAEKEQIQMIYTRLKDYAKLKELEKLTDEVN